MAGRLTLGLLMVGAGSDKGNLRRQRLFDCWASARDGLVGELRRASSEGAPTANAYSIAELRCGMDSLGNRVEQAAKKELAGALRKRTEAGSMEIFPLVPGIG